MTPDKITVGVIAIVKAHAKATNQRDPLPDVNISSNGDLGLDDLDIMEILMESEEVFGLHLDDDRVPLTVEDIVMLIKDRLKEKAAAAMGR